MWTLEKALEFVRKLQPLTRLYGYHLCVGGGVVNNGNSNKDLDLYLLPLDDQNVTADYDGMLMEMEAELGPSEDIREMGIGRKKKDYPDGLWSPYHSKRKFANNGNRVDVFFIKGESA